MNTCHTRRRRRAHVDFSAWESSLTPFQRWMFRCASIPFALVSAAESSSNAIPKCYEEQLVGGMVILCVAASVVFSSAGLALWCVKLGIEIAMRKTQRPKYYPQEKARRMRLAAERRKIRKRTTLNRAPTPDELMAQWGKVRKSPKDMIRFGSMLCDLEAYVDNSLVRNENGEIVGRRSGIKGWLAENCPVLFAKYKTVISYKAMAVKFRQAAGFADPYPPAAAVPEDEGAGGENPMARDGGETTVRKILRGRVLEIAGEVFGRCGSSRRGLLAELDARLDPGKAPTAVRPVPEPMAARGAPASA